MGEKLESVSQAALSGAENAPVVVVEEIPGNRGSDDGVAPDAEEIIVTGRREAPLASPVRRVGVETVIGVDERTRITATAQYPWRMIAALQLTPRPPSTARFIGTAWFIGRRTLLTAGHCVYSDSDFGGWIGSVGVSPGRDGANFPFGTVSATRFSTLDKWKSEADADYDVGCIHIEEPLGDRVGWFNITSLSDADLQNRLLNVSGYPGDRGGGTEQYHHANRVLHPSARRIYYDIDTYGGQSGAPAWVQEDAASEAIAVGVHAYGVGGTPSSLNITANSAPRLTPSLIATIKGWLADDDR
jgi:glutamyl endopeptidase